MIKKVISGGQTGVDRAALDAALESGIPAGGACPKGRLAEDGPIDSKYLMEELSSSAYIVRTRKNVADSEGTLILHLDTLSGGTAATKKFAEELGKPYFVLDLNKEPQAQAVLEWIEKENIEILNVAGPRESSRPGIYRKAFFFLKEMLAR